MEKNGVYEGLVEGLGSEGEGIIKYEGATVFVPFCLVGERVRFKVLKVKGNVAYGKVEKVLNAAYSRTNPPCPVFFRCGGCDLQHMDYAAQLAFKRESVKGTLFKIGGVICPVGEVVPCAAVYRYRNKLALPIGEAGGRVRCGFYRPRSHDILPVDDCLIQCEFVKNVIAAVEKFAAERNIPAYDEATGRGVLRRIVVREIKGKYIVALVAAKPVNADFLIGELEKSLGEITFLINVNASQGNAIFSNEWHICRGNGYFEAEECGVKYRAGANTFLQVNDDVRAKLYARVLDEVWEGEVALDLYSGGGMLTAMLAKKCGTAYGIEVVAEASRCADELKEANGLQSSMFNICGKVEDEIDRAFALTAGKKRVIVCDPPRKGMERSVVRAIERSGADRVILVSCNPATLARDLGLLTGSLEEIGGALYKTGGDGGAYSVESVTPFDMFPQTKHVETLVVLSRKK